MSWLLEDATLILTVAVIIELLLAVALFQTGRGSVLYGMLGVLGVAAAMLTVEGLVVTDREAIAELIQGAAAAIERGDTPTALAAIDPEAPILRDELRRILERYEVQSLRVGAMQISIDRRIDPPRAQATFRIVGEARDRHGQSPYDSASFRLTVVLVRRPEGWRVIDYQSLNGQ